MEIFCLLGYSSDVFSPYSCAYTIMMILFRTMGHVSQSRLSFSCKPTAVPLKPNNELKGKRQRKTRRIFL